MNAQGAHGSEGVKEPQRQSQGYDLWQECTRQLRLMGFSLRQFLTVPYFIQLLISTVLGSVIIQALAVHAAAQSSEGHSVDPTLAWTRAGIVGMWSVCIVSAGIINFERFRGTLVYLCSGSISPVRVLAAIVASASIVGLAALPLSWLIWALVTLNPQVTDFSALWPRYVLGVPLLWLACLSVTFTQSRSARFRLWCVLPGGMAETAAERPGADPRQRTTHRGCGNAARSERFGNLAASGLGLHPNPPGRLHG